MSAASRLSTRELLRSYAVVMRELRTRGVVRSGNSPVADLAEGVAKMAFDLQLSPKSAKGYDGRCSANLRWQVKSRRITPENRSTQSGVIRNINGDPFDVLLLIYFEENFDLRSAYRITIGAVRRHALLSKAQGGHVLHAKGALMGDAECFDVSDTVRSALLKYVTTDRQMAI
jgi:hypothetical protein